MTEGEGLLAAIRDDPGDDVPRLVYADWLDEHGQEERAEFIRLQCELARGAASESRQEKLRRRERDLLVEHELEWVGPLRQVVRRGAFVRGFVERVTVHADRLPRAAELFSTAPIRHLVLLDADDYSPLVAIPGLRQITTLDLRDGCRLTAKAVRLLANAPPLAGVTSLLLRQRSLEEPAIAALTTSRALRRLHTLELYDAVVVDIDLVGPLTRSPHLAGLTTLVLGAQEVRDDGAAAFGDPKCRLTALRRLHLSYCLIGDDGARALARSPHLAGLERLNLAGNPIGSAGRRALRARFGDRVCF
jgi:uncharacterized protein (TIGR02996 family)